MNLYTRYLADRLRDRRLQTFIAQWDTLENVVIQVYKSNQVTPADEADYQTVRRWFNKQYRRWEAPLRPHWQQALVGGRPASADPFRRLTRADSAHAFLGDWEAMQNLPAAREALNRLVQERTGTAAR